MNGPRYGLRYAQSGKNNPCCYDMSRKVRFRPRWKVRGGATYRESGSASREVVVETELPEIYGTKGRRQYAVLVIVIAIK